MSWRVFGMSIISLWGICLLARGTSELANTCTNPCYYHIDAAYDCSMYYQLCNPFCLCPDQQATTCSASSARIYKTTPDHGKQHSPQMDTAIRTLKLETSKRGGPMPLAVQLSKKQPERPQCPYSQRIGPPISEGRMSGSQNKEKGAQNSGG